MQADLSPYIPIDRCHAMAHGVPLPDRATGAALFADISGFTPLTEALTRELGPKRGAEELTRQLNIIYSSLIAEVDRYHGSVLGFSGDAITCWFNETSFEFSVLSSELEQQQTQNVAVRRATACALAMQTVMAQCGTIMTPAGTLITLAIKVAVAAGPVRRFQIGDPQVQVMDALAGATLDRLAAAEHLARKGEVVVAADALDAALFSVGAWRSDETDGVRVAVVRALSAPVAHDPWPALPPDALAEEKLRPWLLAPVYARLRAGQDDFLAELRPAVALFVRFGGIDYDDDPAAGAKLDAFIRWAQRIIARYDGALLQLTIGDKGSYFYCAFGAPNAHDDDPARAVAAALELRAPPPELAYISGVQSGISRGRMRAGPYGGPSRRTYGVLGDEVNMAARLMGKADAGQILVGQRIAESVEKSYELGAIELLQVKGRSEPIPVALVLGRRSASAQRPATLFAHPLVGRAGELAELERVVGAVVAGAGQVLRLEGAAGIGKSHLTAELTERALARGVRVAVGVCQSTTDGVAYAPWRQIFRALLRLAAEPGAAEEPAATFAQQIAAVERFVRAHNPGWLLRLPLLGDLLGLPIADNATTAAFEPRLRQSALLDLAVEIVAASARAAPLLLMVDDAHWMDEASLGLTLALARTVALAPVLLLLVQRPRPADAPLLPEVAALPNHRRLNLDELAPAGVAALVAHRLGGDVDALALALIQAQTQGNPFFVEEVVNALRESGTLVQRAAGAWALAEQTITLLQRANYLVRSDGAWVLAPDVSLAQVDLGLPDSIQEVVLARIDRLPDAHKLTLKVASVIGRTFALKLLVNVHPAQLDEDALFDQITLLEERDFTRLEVLARLIYMFKHNVTHDAAYETLLFSQRRQLHEAVGVALEQLAPEAVAQIAHHAFAGEDWPRALRHQTRAGQQAQKIFANHEALEHFEKALRCAEQLPAAETVAVRQQTHASIGDLLTTMSQYEAALEHLQIALNLAITLADRDIQARVQRGIALLHEKRGEYDPAITAIQQGLDALAGRETDEAAELLLLDALIATRKGDGERAIAQCERSLRIAQQVGETTVLAQSYTMLGHVANQRSDNPTAISYFQQALNLYEQAGDIHGQARVLNFTANAYCDIAQLDQAAPYYRKAQAIFEQVGDVYGASAVANNLGGVARQKGRLDDALASYQQALAMFEQIGGSAWVLGVLHMNLGHTSLLRHDLAAARTSLGRSKSFFDQAEARDFLAELYRYMAEVARLSDDLDQASAAIQQSIAVARELEMRAEEGSSLRVQGEIHFAQGDSGAAERLLNQSLEILRALDDDYEAARTLLALARSAHAQQNTLHAQTLVEHCIVVFARVDAALELDAAQALRAALASAREA